MTAKLLVLAAAVSAFVQPSVPRTKLTQRFFFDQFIANPEADAELDGYVGSEMCIRDRVLGVALDSSTRWLSSRGIMSALASKSK